MKNIIHLVAALSVLFAAIPVWALNPIDAALLDRGYSELLENPSFASGTAGWTASTPSTLTRLTGSNALFGKSSGRFTATAPGQTLSSKLYAVPPGLYGQNCAGTVRYRSAETTNFYVLRVLDGSSNILSQQLSLPTLATGAQNVTASFVCPTIGSIRLQLLSTGVAAPLDFSSAHLGSNVLISGLVNGQPTITYIVTSNRTFTPDAGATQLKIRASGGGGGGGGAGNSTTAAGTGGTGGTTTFGSIITANGGAGGQGGSSVYNAGNIGGAAGSATVTTSASVTGFAVTGLAGSYGGYTSNPSATYPPTPLGGTNALGGAYGTGGAGGFTATNGVYVGAGGGPGGYAEAQITLSAGQSFPIVIGASGSGGALGPSGTSGNGGQPGVVIIEESFQSVTTQAYSPSAGGLSAGDLLYTFAATCPQGTIAADGSTYTVAQYPALYAAIGVLYGGTAGTNFIVPNGSGAFVRGVGSQTFGGVTYSSASQGATQGDLFQGHAHALNNSLTGTNSTVMSYKAGLAELTSIAAPIGEVEISLSLVRLLMESVGVLVLELKLVP